MNGILDIINIPFGYFMRFCYSITGNYAIALLLFALAVKIIFIPFGIKQQKTQIQNAKLRPKMMAIEKKYAGRTDKATMNKKQQEIMDLQQREGVSPLSGCLPLLIQLPVIMALYNIIRKPLTYVCRFSSELITTLKEKAVELNPTLDVKKLDEINLISEMKLQGYESFAEIEGFSSELIPHFEIFNNFDLSAVPTLTSWLVIIPILVFASQFFTMKLSRKLNPMTQMTADTPGNVKMSNAIMDFSMPLMTLFFAFNMSAAIGVYWIYQSVISMIQSVILAKAMPIPVFTEEDFRRAEKEMKVKPPKPASNQPKKRSLHERDDDEEFSPEKAEEAPKTNAKPSSHIGQAPIKSDKKDEPTEEADKTEENETTEENK